MDRALVGGSQKRFALGVVEVTVERYASLEAVDECAGRTIIHTVAACLGMGLGVSHFDVTRSRGIDLRSAYIRNVIEVQAPSAEESRS